MTIQLARHAAGPLRRRHDLRVAHAFEQIVLRRRRRRGSRRSAERAAGPVSSSHRMIAGGVEIGAAVERLAARLLGRHVADLAVDDAGRGLLQLQRRRRQPEVGQLDLAAVRQQHVGRRDVAVDQLQALEGVRVVEAAHQLLDDVNGDRQRERDPLLRAAVPDRAQVLALDEVHAEDRSRP